MMLIDEYISRHKKAPHGEGHGGQEEPKKFFLLKSFPDMKFKIIIRFGKLIITISKTKLYIFYENTN